MRFLTLRGWPRGPFRLAVFTAAVCVFGLVCGLSVPLQAQSAPVRETATGGEDHAVSTGLEVSSCIGDPAVFERRIMTAVKKAVAATVGIRVGGRTGSGVVVSADGLVLTAAHVIGSPGMTAKVLLPDGRELEAETLGINPVRDSGMLRMGGVSGLAHATLRMTDDLQPGDWCLVVGHPGGYQAGRPPVPRIGRILDPSTRAGGSSARFIQTDCPIIGGDSGGGLFDLDGNLIGINSRIEVNVASNFHVPAATFRRNWDRLHEAEVFTRGDARLGLFGVEDGLDGARVLGVPAGRPAALAGLLTGDIITRLDSERVRDARDLRVLLGDYRPGDEIELELVRGEKSISVRVVLAGPRLATPPDRSDGDSDSDALPDPRDGEAS